jgi:uncharacterized protein YxjI
MRYPLYFSFKIAAIASQIYATDADGNQLFYVKQKLFKLKENIEIFTDKSKTTRLYTAKADRVIDFSPLFTLYDETGTPRGTVKRFGKASIWKARYEIQLGPDLRFTVTEANPWTKLLDALLAGVPIVSLVCGYVLHPRYSITNVDGQAVSELKKLPAFFEGKYTLSADTTLGNDEAIQRLFAALMMVVVLRERMRG